MNRPFNLIITGGKTGGHLFPGIATAEALGQLNPEANILFVGTDAPFEVQTLENVLKHRAKKDPGPILRKKLPVSQIQILPSR